MKDYYELINKFIIIRGLYCPKLNDDSIALL